MGVAVKQKGVPAGAGSGAPQKAIAISEPMAIISKGIVQVPLVATAVKGDPIYITAATNALTKTGPGAPPTTYKFGLCVEIAGEGRGVPTGLMRVDLDKKDSFV